MVKLFSSNPGEIGGSSISSFKWSSSEQVWPFEKAADDSTLYCKEIDFGALPNNGQKYVAHNISSLVYSKVHTYYGIIVSNTYGVLQLGFAAVSTGWGNPITLLIDSTDCIVYTVANWSAATAKVRIIYSK